MSARPDKNAIGVTFAAVGGGICILAGCAMYAAQHALLVYGPALRGWLHALAGVPL